MGMSISKVNAFTECPKKFEWIYQKNITPKPSIMKSSSKGTMVHIGIAAGLKAFHEGKSKADIKTEVFLAVKTWAQENAPDPDSPDYNLSYINDEGETVVFSNHDGQAIMQAWEEMYQDAYQIVCNLFDDMNLSSDTWEVMTYLDEPLVEFRIDTIESGYHITGYVDAVLRYIPNDTVYLIDWKVRGNPITVVDRALQVEGLNLQLAVYQYVLTNVLGIRVDAAILYQMKNHSPKLPSLNKNGTMSRVKISTDWATYSYALQQEGLDPNDYLDMAEKLTTKFFIPIYLSKSVKVLRDMWGVFTGHIQDIESASFRDEFLPVYSHTCKFCPFAPLCDAELNDFDIDSIIESRYNVKQVEELEED